VHPALSQPSSTAQARSLVADARRGFGVSTAMLVNAFGRFAIALSE
jgi:hypothetical protein